MPRGKVVYEQVNKSYWRASVIGSNGKHVVGGHGWNTLTLARNGVKAAAKIIKQGREEVHSLVDQKAAKPKKRKR